MTKSTYTTIKQGKQRLITMLQEPEMLWENDVGDPVESMEGKEMTDVYDVYNTLMGIMCDRCAVEIRRDCHKLPDNPNFTQKIRCMKEILEARDDKYPTVLLKIKSKKGGAK